MSDTPQAALLILAPVARSAALAEGLRARVAGAEGVADLAVALTRLTEAPQARLVFLCPRPESWVALALAQGVPPSLAVAQWGEVLRGVMGELRKRRRRTTILFDDSLATAPGACAAALGLDWGDQPAPVLPASDPLLGLLAREALTQNPAAHALACELEASALVPDGLDPAFSVDPDQVFAAFQSGQEQIDGLRTGLEQAAQERDLLRGTVEAGTATLAAERLDAAEKARQLTEAVSAAQGEAALLRDQIRLETAARQAERDAAEARHDALAHAAAARAAEAAAGIAALQAALSDASAKAKTAAQEADLLRDQIRLETAALGESHRALDARTAEAAALRDRVQALQSERDAAEARSAAAATAASAEIAALQAARSKAQAAADAATRQAETAAAKAEAATREAALLRDQIRLETAALGDSHRALDARNSEAAALRDRVQALQEACDTAEARLDALARAGAVREGLLAANAEAALAAAHALQADLTEAAAKARAEADRSAAEAALLRDQLRLESSALHATRAELAVQSARAAEASAALERLQSQAARQADAAEERLTEARDTAQTVVRQLREQLYQMGQGLESYHAQLEALQIERQELLAQIRQLHDIRQELEGYFDRSRQLSAQVEALSVETQRLQGEVETGQAALADSRHLVEGLQGEMQRIYKSRSYRLMSPLRRMRVALKDAG